MTRHYHASMKLPNELEMLFAHLKRVYGMARLRLRGPCDTNVKLFLAAALDLRRLAQIFPVPWQKCKARSDTGTRPFQWSVRARSGHFYCSVSR